MAVGFIDLLGRGGKTEQYPQRYFLVEIVVLVERADSQSAAGLGPIFEEVGEWKLAFAIESRRLMGVSHSEQIQLDG